VFSNSNFLLRLKNRNNWAWRWEVRDFPFGFGGANTPRDSLSAPARNNRPYWGGNSNVLARCPIVSVFTVPIRSFGIYYKISFFFPLLGFHPPFPGCMHHDACVQPVVGVCPLKLGRGDLVEVRNGLSAAARSNDPDNPPCFGLVV